MAGDTGPTGSVLHDALEELSGALGRAVGASGRINHQLLKGEFRERRVIAGLRQFIPRRYEMTSGVITNADGAFSRQQDIILSDSMISPPFIAAGDLGVVPIEAVSGVIEVKSIATRADVTAAVENIASVKRLASDDARPFALIDQSGLSYGDTNLKPFGGAIFLSSGAATEALLESFADAARNVPMEDRPNAMVVVGDACICWHAGGPTPPNGADPSTDLVAQAGSIAAAHSLGERALLMFYVIAMKVISSYPQPTLDLVAYVNAGGGLGDHRVDWRTVGQA